MISAILEITSCVIAAIFGIIGVMFGDVYTTAIGGTLILLIVIYLSKLGEIMQGKSSKVAIKVCEVLNKAIYVTIVALIIASAMMV